MSIDPRDFGRLEGKVDGIASQVNEMREDVSKLSLLASPKEGPEFVMDQARWTNMVRGNIKVGVSFVIAISGSLVYLAIQWMNYLHTKLGGAGLLPPGR